MRVLLLDPGWPQTGYLLAHLAAVGADVVRAVAGPFDRVGLGGLCRHVQFPTGGPNVAWLASLIDSVNPKCVVPLSEELQRVAWDLPSPQRARVFPDADAQQRHVLGDRPSMYELASSSGVPIPDSMPLPDDRHVDEAVTRLGLPLVIRGTQGLGGAQVKIAHTLEEAKALTEAMRHVSPGVPFAQPFLGGRRCLIGGLFHEGRMLQWFSQTTLEASPPPTGPSVVVQSFRHPLLTEYARRLFGSLRWTGLACAEFMYDGQDGFRFLEVNPRPWAAIQAAHVCGVPLFRSFVEFLTGTVPRQASLASEFDEGRSVYLFPQYLLYRLDLDGGLRLRHLRQLLASVSIAPWRHPRLMLHYARTIAWGLGLR